MIPILSARKITKNYGKEQVIKGIVLTLYRGTFTVILGPSGSGKSTLLNILSGMLKPTIGTVEYEEKLITSLSPTELSAWKRDHIGYVFQNYMLLSNLTVEENIKVGISSPRAPLPFDRVTHILEIDELLKKFPAQLSGGQQQRVAVARAVIKGPDLIFCDEATGALDEKNSKKVIELLHGLKKTFGVTILFTTHNEQIAHTADRIITMKDGMIVSDVYNRNPVSANDMIWGKEYGTYI